MFHNSKGTRMPVNLHDTCKPVVILRATPMVATSFDLPISNKIRATKQHRFRCLGFQESVISPMFHYATVTQGPVNPQYGFNLVGNQTQCQNMEAKAWLIPKHANKINKGGGSIAN